MRNSMAVAAAGFALTLLTLPGWVTMVYGSPWRSFSRCGACHWALSGTGTGKTIPASFPQRYIVTVKDSEYEINCRILNYNYYHVQQKRT